MKVLIVDDQEPFRAAAREVVDATDGFEVVGEAVNGEESVSVARRLRPDLVLMDIHLPGVDGLEASRRIRSDRAEVVVFLMSTYDQGDFDSRLGSSRASAFIPKDAFGPPSLAAAWRSAQARPPQSR